MYCTVCKRMLDEVQVCPHCLSTQVRQPKNGDEVFLIDKPMLWKDAIADLLKEEKIPFISRAKLGAGFTMSVGLGQESYRFYVPYEHLLPAQALMEELFAPVEGDMEE